jgi:hypothetical protein
MTDMTKLGKVLVVANFVVSVVVAGWAAGFYFTAIDWTAQKGKDGAPDGQLAARVARLTDLKSAAGPGEAGWREARALVRDREAFRAGDRALYQNEIAFVYTAPANQRLHEVVIDDKTGQPLLAQEQGAAANKAHFLPTFRDIVNRVNGKELRSLDFYAKAYADNLVALKKSNDALTALLKEDADLTVELAGGTKVDGMVVEKGLRKRIEDERVKGLDALAEYEIVRPLLIKTVGDSEFLLARRRQLEKRIKDLQEAAKVTKAQ